MNSETAQKRLAATCAMVAVVILTAHAPVCPGADGSCGGAVLSTMLRELATVDAIAVIWFQVFDRLYLEAPQWASDAFDHIGVMDLSGTPQESFVVRQKTSALPRVRPSRRVIGRLGPG